MQLKKIFMSVVCVSMLSACSTTSKDVQSVYISPLQYSSFDCGQLIEESQRIRVRASQIAGHIDEDASKGNLATTAAVLIFWPAAFFTGKGNKEQQAELARLKGEQDAIEQSAIHKKCSIAATANSTATAQN